MAISKSYLGNPNTPWATGGYTSNSGGKTYTSVNSGGYGPSYLLKDETIDNIIYELPKLGLNLDKISKLESEEDKKRIIHMFTEICKMAIQYETRDNTFNSFHFKMLYNSLYNCDFLCTNRNKNLTNLLEDEK